MKIIICTPSLISRMGGALNCFRCGREFQANEKAGRPATMGTLTHKYYCLPCAEIMNGV